MTKKLSSFVSPTALNESILQGRSGTLLDVRTPAEFADAHIAGSLNVPLHVLPGQLAQLDRSKQVVVVCRTGRRAKEAARLLDSQGFDAIVLENGVVGWDQCSLDLVRGGERLSIERQAQLTIALGVLIGLTLGVFVHPWFLAISAAWAFGLMYAALSGTCPLAMALAKAPWNSTQAASGKSSCCT